MMFGSTSLSVSAVLGGGGGGGDGGGGDGGDGDGGGGDDDNLIWLDGNFAKDFDTTASLPLGALISRRAQFF